MNAGKLDQRITIQTPTGIGSPPVAQDEIGQPLAGWTDVVECWAGVVDVSGREFVAAGAQQNAALTKITIRYRAGIVPKMRVLHRSIAYNIETVLGQDGKSLTLMCRREDSL